MHATALSFPASVLAQQGASNRWGALAAAVAAAIGVALVAVVVVRAGARQRQARAEAQGGAIEAAVGDLEAIADVAALRRRYEDLPGLNRMRGEVKAAYRADLDGRALTIFQHTFSTMVGSTPVTVHHTVYGCAAPRWPTVKIAPRRFFSRVALAFGKASGVMLENHDFNRAFWVGAEDEAFAVTLLSPAMQAFLLERPDLRWRIRGGEVVLIYRGPLKPQRMGGSFERLRRFWSLVPPELEAWTARYGEASPGATR